MRGEKLKKVDGMAKDTKVKRVNKKNEKNEKNE